MASLALLIALLASSLPAVDSKTFALCSDPGCIVLNSTKSPPLPDIGVHLTTTNDAEVQEVWLLPGSYDADTQELSGIEGLLKPFFDAPDVDKGLGFDVDINDTAITVFMHHNASLLAYGSEHFQGQSSTKDEKKLKSFILRTNVTARKCALSRSTSC